MAATMEADDLEAPPSMGGDVFAAVRARAQSNDPQARQLAVVLAAVTDVVCARKRAGGDRSAPSVTEFFAALMSAFEQQRGQPAAAAAALHLLTLVLPRVPRGVLQARAQPALDVFLGALGEERAASDPAFCRRLLSCAAAVLRALGTEPAAWAQKWALKGLQALLVFAVDPRHKVRKAAQQVRCRRRRRRLQAAAHTRAWQGVFDVFAAFDAVPTGAGWLAARLRSVPLGHTWCVCVRAQQARRPR